MGQRRLRRRIVFALIVLLLAAGAYLGYQNREFSPTAARSAPGAKAKTLATGLFLQGRDEASVLAEDIGCPPSFKNCSKAKVDRGKAGPSRSLFSFPGLFKKTAVYLDKIGTVLLNGVEEADVRGLGSWTFRRPEPADTATRLWPDGDLLPEEPIPKPE